MKRFSMPLVETTLIESSTWAWIGTDAMAATWQILSIINGIVGAAIFYLCYVWLKEYLAITAA